MGQRILAVYPRKNATRIGLYDDDREVRRAEILHDRGELQKFDRVSEQWSHRLRALEELLTEWGAAPDEMEVDAVIGPAGIPGNVPGGVYAIDNDLLKSLKKERETEHYTDLGATLADALARVRKSRGFAVVSLSSSEFDPVSKISGLPELPFGRMLHALSIKDVVHRASVDLDIPFDKLSVVVAYLGKSFSICSHSEGRVRDLANANERGPFSPSRSGGIPATEIVRLAYSGMWSMEDLYNHLVVAGGMKSYTGTDNLLEVAKRNALGDGYAGLIYRSMAYQVVQEIAAQATVLKGRLDAVILTGGCAKDELFTEILRERLAWITEKLMIYPSVDELESMATAALRVLKDQEPAQLLSKVTAA